MQVLAWDEKQDGPLSEAAMRRKLDRMGYDVSRYAYPPGTVFDFHTHAVDKIDGVLSGQFRITMDDGSVVLEAGDAIVVPRGASHRAEVVGSKPVVSFDAVKR